MDLDTGSSSWSSQLGERNFSSTSLGPLSIVNGHTLSDDNFLNETQI